MRNERSLIQTAGRAARNVNGKVIMYANKITKSMQRTMDETERKRAKQIAYNEAMGITPTTVSKSREQIIEQLSVLNIKNEGKVYIEPENNPSLAADPIVQYMSRAQLEKSIEQTRKKMQQAAKELDFMMAARHRD